MSAIAAGKLAAALWRHPWILWLALAGTVGGVQQCRLMSQAAAIAPQLRVARKAGVDSVQMDAALRIGHAKAEQLRAEQLVRTARATRDRTIAKADSTASALTRAITRVPQSVRDSHPEVDALIRESAKLQLAFRPIRADVFTADQADDERHDVNTSLLTAAQVTIGVWQDSTRIARDQRDARPTWTQTGKIAAAAAALGGACAKYCDDAWRLIRGQR